MTEDTDDPPISAPSQPNLFEPAKDHNDSSRDKGEIELSDGLIDQDFRRLIQRNIEIQFTTLPPTLTAGPTIHTPQTQVASSLLPEQLQVTSVSLSNKRTHDSMIDQNEKKKKTKKRKQENEEKDKKEIEASCALVSQHPNLRKLAGRSRLVDITMLPNLRIVKRDFRRRYTEMYNNVMNNHDADLLDRFLRDFCTPECRFVINMPAGVSPPVQQGIEQIVRYTMQASVTMPDNFQALSNSKIHVALGTPGSRIISTVLFKGTVLFEIPSLADMSTAAMAGNALLSPSSSSEDKTAVTQQDRLAGIVGVPPGLPMGLQLARINQPREVTVKGILTMQLDDANRIEKFVVDAFFLQTIEVPVQSLSPSPSSPSLPSQPS